MSLNEEKIALFDKYFKSELNTQEKQAFEDCLNTDGELYESYQLYLSAIESVKTYHIGEEMGHIIDRNANKKKQLWYLAAAAIILLIIVPYAYFGYFQSASEQELYQSYFEVYPADQNPRGEEKIANQAMDLYRKGSYTQAISSFTKLAIKDTRYYLYLGNCYLLNHEPESAISALIEAKKSTSTIVRQTSEWYLALAYLKDGDVKATIKQLMEIDANSHLYRQKAKQLLNELD